MDTNFTEQQLKDALMNKTYKQDLYVDCDGVWIGHTNPYGGCNCYTLYSLPNNLTETVALKLIPIIFMKLADNLIELSNLLKLV